MTQLAPFALRSLVLLSLLLVGACTTTHEPAASDRHLLLIDGDFSEVERAVVDRGGRVESAHAATGILTVVGLDDTAVRAMEALPQVVALGRDEHVNLLPHVVGEPRLVASEAAAHGEGHQAEHFGRQWHLSAIGAHRAWAAGHVGSSQVTVAVLDTGIDYRHPDLEGRVDLARSVSFVPSDDALLEETFVGRHPVTDLHYHGTHVAATIASNAVSAAGVTSETTLIGVKVLGQDGVGPLSGIVRGILHAVDSGADVVNMSLGGSWRRTGFDWFLGIVHVALHYAKEQGVTVVVSAGNEGRDLDDDPALFDLFCEAELAVCVSATGPTASEGDFGPYTDVDALAPDSNTGESVDVAAPGGYAEPVWAACSSASLHLDCAKRGTIVGMSGTSMAAPHASGVAALLVAVHGPRPELVRGILEGSAVDRGEAGWDEQYGWGRLDAARALGLP